MTPNHPVHSIDECFAYLKNNQWQFPLLDPSSPVTINAAMLRSLYFHIGCAKFGVPLPDNITELAEELRRLALQAPKP